MQQPFIIFCKSNFLLLVLLLIILLWWCFSFLCHQASLSFLTLPLIKLSEVQDSSSVLSSDSLLTLLFKFNLTQLNLRYLDIGCKVGNLSFFVFQMVNYASIILGLCHHFTSFASFHELEMFLFSYTKYLDTIGSTYGFSTSSHWCRCLSWS